jgi:hypothetical protein
MTKLNIIFLTLLICLLGAKSFASDYNENQKIQYEGVLEVFDLLCMDECDPTALIQEIKSLKQGEK